MICELDLAAAERLGRFWRAEHGDRFADLAARVALWGAVLRENPDIRSLGVDLAPREAEALVRVLIRAADADAA